MLEIKNAVVVVVRIFMKYNGLCGVLADSNYFYIEEPIPCTNFHVREMPVRSYSVWYYITLGVIVIQGKLGWLWTASK